MSLIILLALTYSPQPAAHGLLHPDSPQTLQPMHINGNWICLMVWNIPVRG